MMKMDAYVKKIWDYHHMNHTLEKADCIIVLGSHDTRVAERSAEVFLEGWAPLMVFSGYLGAFTDGVWERPEAEIFADIAIRMGVPEDRILIENRSTNTGENVLYSRKILVDAGIYPGRVIAVQKPYMERRTFATFRKLWPETEIMVTSPRLTWEEYSKDETKKQEDINIIVGDLQRILVYPRRGYQIYQEVPADVMEAYRKLVEMGYTKRLLHDINVQDGSYGEE